jgi:hypothetical protein
MTLAIIKRFESLLWAVELGLARRKQPAPAFEPAYDAPPVLPEWQVRLRRMNQRFALAKRSKA